MAVTRQLQVGRRSGEVRRPETDVLPLCHATNQGWQIRLNDCVRRLLVALSPGVATRPVPKLLWAVSLFFSAASCSENGYTDTSWRSHCFQEYRFLLLRLTVLLRAADCVRACCLRRRGCYPHSGLVCHFTSILPSSVINHLFYVNRSEVATLL